MQSVLVRCKAQSHNWHLVCTIHSIALSILAHCLTYLIGHGLQLCFQLAHLALKLLDAPTCIIAEYMQHERGDGFAVALRHVNGGWGEVGSHTEA